MSDLFSFPWLGVFVPTPTPPFFLPLPLPPDLTGQHPKTFRLFFSYNQNFFSTVEFSTPKQTPFLFFFSLSQNKCSVLRGDPTSLFGLRKHYSESPPKLFGPQFVGRLVFSLGTFVLFFFLLVPPPFFKVKSDRVTRAPPTPSWDKPPNCFKSVGNLFPGVKHVFCRSFQRSGPPS